MREISPYAPNSPTGPGTSINNPFRTVSIADAYALLNRIHYKTSTGREKISYDRVGPVNSPGFKDPVDHYILTDSEKRKIADFYIYSYSNYSNSDSDLPEPLLIFKLDDETYAMFDKIVQSNPELKKAMDEQLLFRVNMARMQRGLAPLSSLPRQGSCLLTAFTLLSVLSLGAYCLTIYIKSYGII